MARTSTTIDLVVVEQDGSRKQVTADIYDLDGRPGYYEYHYQLDDGTRILVGEEEFAEARRNRDWKRGSTQVVPIKDGSGRNRQFFLR